MRKRLTIPRLLLCLLPAVSLLEAAGCAAPDDASSGTERAERTPVGELSLALILPSGLQIDAVRYEITGNGVMISGTLPVVGSGMDFSAFISDIPVGTRYTLSLSAMPLGDAGVGCLGSAQFNSVQGATTQVNVTLSCDEVDHSGAAIINGGFNVCPSIQATMFSPVMQTVGEQVTLGVTARDLDHAPSPLSYSWTSSAGTFADGSTATPTFRCAQPGDTNITVQVSDGQCSKSRTLSVLCVAAPDAGIDAGSDAAVAPVDSGVAPADSGVAPVDSGAVPVDSGTAPVDSGVPPAVTVRVNEVESSDGTPGDWVEFYNYGTSPVNLSGWTFRDSSDTHLYTFPAGTTLAAGAFLVLDEAVLTFGLGDTDEARLYPVGSTTLSDSYAWATHATTTYGRCPDGTGAFATTATSTKGGANVCTPPPTGIVINEVESRGGTPGDWIEIFNAGTSTADLSNWVVKDGPETAGYTIAVGTTLAPGAYLVLDEAQFLFGLGDSDAARLFYIGGSMLIDSYSWSTHAVNTYGRCPNGSGAFADTASPSKGAANVCPSASPPAHVVLNEVESQGGNPGDWVELYNTGTVAVDVSGWVFKDSNDTNAYVIPPGTSIAAGGYLVLNEAQFIFGLGAGDAARLYLFQSGTQTLSDSFAWTVHATTTYGRCPNGTGPFVTTIASTKGSVNSCSP
jgi:hypothetical protein